MNQQIIPTLTIEQEIKAYTEWIFQPEAPLKIEDFASEERYGLMPGVRSTWLKNIRRSPGHMLREIQSPSEPTPAMKVGTAVHHAVLVGLETLRLIIIDDDLNLNTKEGRALKEQAETEMKNLIRKQTYLNILTMREMLMNDPDIGPMFKGAMAEVAVAAPVQVGDSTLACKTKVDLLPDGDFIVDLKCVSSAEVDSFARLCYKFGYATQGVHYMKTWNSFIDCKSVIHEIPERLIRPRNKFLLVAIEPEPPHAYRKFMFGEEFLRIGENHWLEAATTLMQCVQTGRYPLYPSSIAVLKPPQREDARWLEEEL